MTYLNLENEIEAHKFIILFMSKQVIYIYIYVYIKL